MNTQHKILAAILGLGLTAGAAQAQPVDQRHFDQQQRIEQGVHSGQVTRHEARGMERQQASIYHQEARMRAHHDGHLTRYDRARLQHREDHASARIYRDKHNYRVG